MKSVNNKIMPYLFFFCFLSIHILSETQIRLICPVRIFQEKHPIHRLKKETIKLVINGTERNIIEINPKQKSIGILPELGRYFILSFQSSVFNNEIKKRVSFLVTEILNNRDTLIIISPLKIYQLNVSPNKENLIHKINDILIQDYYMYNQKKISDETNLHNKIKKLKWTYSNPAIYQSPFRETINFLSTYPQEFFRFSEKYLKPSIENFQQVNKILNLKEGERWWIHFLDYRFYDLLIQTINIGKDISQYVYSRIWQQQALQKTITGKLAHFEKSLLMVKKFPAKKIVDTLLKGNINFNVFFSSWMNDTSSNASNLILIDIKKFFNTLSRLSGGISINSKETIPDMEKIKNHKDHYFDLVYYFNGKIEPKSLRMILKPNQGTQISYPKEIDKDEIENLIRYQSLQKISIKDFKIFQHRIQFNVESFKLNYSQNKKDQFGLLKIIVHLLNLEKESIFNNTKTMRAVKPKLGISFSLPGRFKGNFLINITLIDIIGNSKTTLSRPIQLK